MNLRDVAVPLGFGPAGLSWLVRELDDSAFTLRTLGDVGYVTWDSPQADLGRLQAALDRWTPPPTRAERIEALRAEVQVARGVPELAAAVERILDEIR